MRESLSEVAAGTPRVAPHVDPEAPPFLYAGDLDALWFQVAGTRCNLRCTHCFVSCGPHNRSFGFLSIEEVRRRLDESVPLGVREYYFTGGEPFLHPRIVEVLSLALEYGPATVLTNGTLVTPEHAGSLASAAASSPYSLEIRLSIDGVDAASHDAIRGPGSFRRALEGLAILLREGFLPIVTAVQTWPPGVEERTYRSLVAMLRAAGYERPRIKLLPTFRIGAESARSRGYAPSERVTNAMLEEYDPGRLLCASARVVTDRGVWVCPILLEAPEGDLGPDLAAAAAAPFRLRHGACYTCWLHGAICANPGGEAPEYGTVSAAARTSAADRGAAGVP